MECSICKNRVMDELLITHCRHIFCRHCILFYVEYMNSKCPSCDRFVEMPNTGTMCEHGCQVMTEDHDCVQTLQRAVKENAKIINTVVAGTMDMRRKFLNTARNLKAAEDEVIRLHNISSNSCRCYKLFLDFVMLIVLSIILVAGYIIH
ncbi:uncharacterized protein LOC119666209 [Teleopsis dalmanni]|uniref:uncharacterized protein LOC119666209 n=1 Tax=Teleopsis dalmanni TaxID=139649 RepID=UPI0018CD9668|nr:uncharacterized protein LOC119666209 [Teleopsis dalmanni]